MEIPIEAAEIIAFDKLTFYYNHKMYLKRPKMKKAIKPLDPITSKKHAENIIGSRKRHKFSEYENNLLDLHNLEKEGLIKESSYRNLAKKGITRRNVLDVKDGNCDYLDEEIIDYIHNRLKD
ncbi:MAG: hypothetical protein Q4F54_05700 [Coriobacteriia bacterium]|nr:hypothetical protein [Coriobacteriia bacterium]